MIQALDPKYYFPDLPKLSNPTAYRKHYLKNAQGGNNQHTIDGTKIDLEKLHNTDNPLVSIITVCRNSAKTLEQTFQSIQKQSYRNIEHVIIDGHSTDNTLSIIQKHQNKISFWKSAKDRNLYDAMNQGVLACHGSIIGILNSDDYYEPDAVQLSVDAIQSGFDFSFAAFNLITLDESAIMHPVKKEPPNDWYYHITDMPFGHQTLFVKKSAYEKIGLFREEFLLAADYDFIHRLYRNQLAGKLILKPITNYRNGGLSYRQSDRSIEEGIKICETIVFHNQTIPWLMKFKLWKKKVRFHQKYEPLRNAYYIPVLKQIVQAYRELRYHPKYRPLRQKIKKRLNQILKVFGKEL